MKSYSLFKNEYTSVSSLLVYSNILQSTFNNLYNLPMYKSGLKPFLLFLGM